MPCAPVTGTEGHPPNRACHEGCDFIVTLCCPPAQIVQVGNDHGIRFPRELGMLLKQLLYFDRYTRILAPQMSVLQDDRIRLS